MEIMQSNSKNNVIINVVGGIGNQMFIYVYARYLYYMFGNEIGEFFFNYEDSESAWTKRSFRIHTLFSLDGVSVTINKMQDILNEKDLKTTFIEEKNVSSFQFQNPDSGKNENSVFKGFWQSYQYFEFCRNYSTEPMFKFPEERLNDLSARTATDILCHTSVCIHIRRTDYYVLDNILAFGNVCDLEYYRQAKILLEAKVKDPTYYVFADDPDWVKLHLDIQDARIIDWNCAEEDAWQDLYLMSLCKHTIIANSSFSWWGASLNDHPEKIVIAPLHWLNVVHTKDLIPEKWLRISTPLCSEKDYDDLTIILSLNEKQLRSVCLIQQIRYLSQFRNMHVCILLPNSPFREFQGDPDIRIFNRVEDIITDTEYVGIWRVDLFLSPMLMEVALHYLKEGKTVISTLLPYCYLLDERKKYQFRHTMDFRTILMDYYSLSPLPISPFPYLFTQKELLPKISLDAEEQIIKEMDVTYLNGLPLFVWED